MEKSAMFAICEYLCFGFGQYNGSTSDQWLLCNVRHTAAVTRSIDWYSLVGFIVQDWMERSNQSYWVVGNVE
jgi:hypothetical protein